MDAAVIQPPAVPKIGIAFEKWYVVTPPVTEFTNT
jgi:hypothetical protein